MCRMCGINFTKMCRTCWRGVGHSLRLSISRGITQLLKSSSLSCSRTLNLFQKCFHGIKRPNPNRRMRCGSARALWDVPVYADSIEVRTRKIDTRIVDKEQKRVFAIKMSCPIWLEYREAKEMEKTQKYCLLMWELREKNPG